MYFCPKFTVYLRQKMRDNISKIIRERIGKLEAGSLFAVNDFIDLNNDSLVTRTLSRLQKEGVIVRVATGIYMIPKRTQFGILYPTINQIATKIAERDKAQIMPTGDMALNILGLSTQVPMNAVYITNGAKRKVKVGERNIVFKNVVQKNFQFKGKLLPLIIIALKELGEKQVTEEMRIKLTKLILESNADEQATMMHDLYLSPVWIRELLLPIIKTATK